MGQSALEALCEKYNIPAGYTPTTLTLDGRSVACRSPPEGSNIICVYADALEAGMRIPLHKFYVAVLAHYGLAPSQLAPDAWRSMAAFVLLSKDAGVEPMLEAFLSLFCICTHDGDSVGWHHFKSRPGSCLFSDKMPRSPEWKRRFFYLRSPSTRPWPCAVRWGKPSIASVRMPVVTGDTDLVMKKLLNRAAGSSGGIDVMQFLSRRSLPVAPPPVSLTITTPPQKHKLFQVMGAAGAAAGPAPLPEPTRKRKSSSDTHTQGRGLMDCIAEFFAEASELAKKDMAELDATKGEVAQLNAALSVANAQHAAEVRRLADEHHKASTAHSEEVAKLQAEHAAAVSQLTDNLKEYVAAVSQVTERLNKEHAAAVSKLTEHLKKEHAVAVTHLKEKHAAEVGQLADEHRKAAEHAAEHHRAEREAEVAELQGKHAAAVAQLKEDHAISVDRLREQHAADVVRLKDAAEKEVLDTKKKVMLHLFPKLDVSLLEQPKFKGDPSSAETGTPKAEGRS